MLMVLCSVPGCHVALLYDKISCSVSADPWLRYEIAKSRFEALPCAAGRRRPYSGR